MNAILAIRIFTPFALGYLFVSIFRSISAVIAPDLVRDLDLQATGLGFATSAFFLSAILFQLPYGILLDRYDPRRLYPIFLILCALGAVITALSQGMFALAMGRALIALGASASAVTSFKVYSMWFPTERLPLVNGLSLATGGVGLIAGTVPVDVALAFIDWRDIHLIVAVMIVAAAALVLIAAPEGKDERSGLTMLQQFLGLSVILKSMTFWRVAPLMMSALGIYAGFAALWAGPWIRDVAGIKGSDAAIVLLILAGAMTVSGLATGPIASLAKRFGIAPLELSVLTTGLFGIVLIVLFLQWTPSQSAVFATWAMFGFIAPLNFVTYAALKPQFPPEYTGRLNACLTLAWMFGGFLTQNLYGVILDRFPSTDGSYAAEGHRAGMAVMIVLLISAMGWYFASSRLIRSREISSQVEIEAPIN